MASTTARTRPLPSLEVLNTLFWYDPLTGVFTWKASGPKRRVGAVAGCRESTYYWRLSVNGHTWKAHRIAYYMGTGVDPVGHEIDHIDGDALNNRLANLRMATHAQNRQNLNPHRKNTSGYMGVSWHVRVGRYAARIHRGRTIHLGYFNTALEAAAAYEGAAAVIRGEWHRQRL